MKKVLVFIAIQIAFVNQYASFAQSKTMDSLQHELQQATQDTSRLKLYIALGDACDMKDNLLYAEPAMKIADKLLAITTDKEKRKSILKQKIEAYHIMGAFYLNHLNPDLKKEAEFTEKMNAIYIELKDTNHMITNMIGLSQFFLATGNFTTAIEYTQKALAISTQMDYKKGIAICLSQMGNMYRDQGEDTLALENYQQALTIANQLKDSAEIYSAIAGMGGVYHRIHNIQKALECYNKVISICELKKWDHYMYAGYRLIGDVYKDNNDFPHALLSYQKSLLMTQKINDKERMRNVLDDIGSVYNSKGDYPNALKYHLMALKISKELKAEYPISYSHYCLAKVYFNQKNYKAAQKYIYLALPVAYRNFLTIDLVDFELLTSQIDSANKNGMAAYAHYKQYVALQNKLNGEEVHKAAQLETFRNERVKQKIAQEKKDAALKEERSKQKLILWFVVSGLLLVMVFAGFIYRSLRLRNKQNQLIASQKDNIENSYNNLELLNTISNEITSSLNLENVMRSIYKNVSSLMDISFFIISTYNADKETVSVKYCVREGKEVHEVFETSTANPTSFTALTIKNKSEIIINDLEKEYSKWLPGSPQLHGKEDLRTESMVFIPLFIKDKVIGLYSVQSKKINAFTTANLAMLRSLSSVIAVALNNADSYTKLDTANSEILKQKDIAEKEKQRSDELLLNILPAEVAEELKETGSAKAKSFDSVTVLFTDFKNFTQASETLSAEELVKEIKYCYSEFDQIISKYGIEKIKTIGDSYMCAGGLPISNNSHPCDVVKAGLELQQFILLHNQEKIKRNEPYFELRLGIHTGPVVAGIVGIKKFAYDIWGDTVNTASRMESSGEPGKVNISGATYELVKDQFSCEYRGKILAKNKGEIDMYFVSSIIG